MEQSVTSVPGDAEAILGGCYLDLHYNICLLLFTVLHLVACRGVSDH